MWHAWPHHSEVVLCAYHTASHEMCMQVGKAIGALVAQGMLDLKRMAEHVLTAEPEEDSDNDDDDKNEDGDTGTPLDLASPVTDVLWCDPNLSRNLKCHRPTKWH